MEYLKKFETHAEYEQYAGGGGMKRPNVSYCEDVKDVHYNPIIDWSKEYFTTVALEDGTISFDIWKNMGTDMITSISYSTDNGETWATTNNVNNKEENLVITVNVNKGDKVLWKGNAQQLGLYDEDYSDDYIGSFFSSTCPFDAMGNVMSLLYGDNFVGETTIKNDYCFSFLFSVQVDERECLIVNANNLVFPATTLASNCYRDMFSGCTNLVTPPQLLATTLAVACCLEMFDGCSSLTTAPQLPATTLANYCYQNMFNGCTSLTSAPQLPATTLAKNCYYCMFGRCTSLTNAPQLPATTLAYNCYFMMFASCKSLTTVPQLPAITLADSCYNCMFQGCTSLATAPELLATTLANNCYHQMFDGCTSLTTAPQLPVTTLTQGCYSYMFRNCTSLATAPQLPATTLVGGCYTAMFDGCTSLTTAPQLPAITLAEGCYMFMFQGCTNLNYIKCLATNFANNSTYNWVINVALSGTFVKNANSWPSGINGIPNGWTVEIASE